MTLPCALILPCVFLSTLGKIYVCRVPVNLHSANLGAHGKNEVSGSGTSFVSVSARLAPKRVRESKVLQHCALVLE